MARTLASLIVVPLLTITALHAQQTPDPTVPLIGENLIVNGSFELTPAGPVPPGEVPEGWANEAYGGRDGQLSIAEDAAPGEGKHCLQVTVTAENPSSGVHGPFMEIDPTQAYLQSGWIRLDREYPRSGMNLGRQWFDAEQQSVEEEQSRSYTYVVSSANPGAEWAYYQQLLLPDPDPADGKFSHNEIPSTARFLRIWAITYNWDGTGYFDGLRLQRVDYAAMARPKILDAFEQANVEALRAEIEALIDEVPADHDLHLRTADLLAEQARINREALQEAERPVNDWIADENRTPALLNEMNDVRWELKTFVLLRGA